MATPHDNRRILTMLAAKRIIKRYQDIKARNMKLRTFRPLWKVLCATLCIGQSALMINQYIKREMNSEVKYFPTDPIILPAVTVCSESPFKDGINRTDQFDTPSKFFNSVKSLNNLFDIIFQIDTNGSLITEIWLTIDCFQQATTMVTKYSITSVFKLTSRRPSMATIRNFL